MTGQLRPWRDHERSHTTTDRQVVSSLADSGPARPRDVARGRFRENVIRLQCRYLERVGVLSTVTADTYRLSSDGWSVFDNHREIDSPEYVDLSPVVSDDTRRLSDLSVITSRGLKEVNLLSFNDTDLPYGYVRGDQELTKQRVHNVKDYKIDRLVREFPRVEPLCCQCAHWVRAVVGLHFFPDANHRTAMGTLRELLNQNGVLPDSEWPFEPIDTAVTRSKLLREHHCRVRFDTLWEHDELYFHWLRYFRSGLFDISTRPRSELSVEFLDQVLAEARRIQREL